MSLVRTFYLLLSISGSAAIPSLVRPFHISTSFIPLASIVLSNKAASSNKAQNAVTFPFTPFPYIKTPFSRIQGFSPAHIDSTSYFSILHPSQHPAGEFASPSPPPPWGSLDSVPHLLFIFIRHDILMFRRTPLPSPRTHSLNIRRNELFIR